MGRYAARTNCQGQDQGNDKLHHASLRCRWVNLLPGGRARNAMGGSASAASSTNGGSCREDDNAAHVVLIHVMLAGVMVIGVQAFDLCGVVGARGWDVVPGLLPAPSLTSIRQDAYRG